MSECPHESEHEREGVPEDYPGRIVRFPEGRSHLVVALFGCQGADDAARAAFSQTLAALLADGAARADRIERGECRDASGVPTSLTVAYWSDPTQATAWWESNPVSTFWNGLPLDGDCGYFVERMTMPAERFNYAAGTEDRHGSAGVHPLTPCKTFGYWGAYRDRLPASADDPFKSPLDTLTERTDVASRGCRLTVTVPDNLCYIREGQGWANCQDAERRIWNENMNPVIDEWVARLGANPAETGCLSIRDCAEYDGETGAALERRSQFAFLWSLGHIEQAARTDPAHLAVHGTFVKMYREPQFTPQMHVWVEVGVMKSDEVFTEYVNCHSMTGLLPYFESHAVGSDARDAAQA